jgi:hypothetical protein
VLTTQRRASTHLFLPQLEQKEFHHHPTEQASHSEALAPISSVPGSVVDQAVAADVDDPAIAEVAPTNVHLKDLDLGLPTPKILKVRLEKRKERHTDMDTDTMVLMLMGIMDTDAMAVVVGEAGGEVVVDGEAVEVGQEEVPAVDHLLSAVPVDWEVSI